MGIFSFFARNDNSEALSQPEVDLTIDNMCSQVEYLQAELLRATNLCELANKQFDDFRKQIEKYKSEAQNLKKTNADLWTRLEARNVRLIELNEAQRWLDAERLKRITVSQESLAFEEEAIKNGLAVRALTKSNPSLPNNVQSLEEAASLPAQPFVILLVDGDQYSVWLVTFSYATMLTLAVRRSPHEAGDRCRSRHCPVALDRDLEVHPY